jgi:putative PIN family toxin of toxin-antitoxin system
MRVVVDTNVLISSYFNESSRPGRVVRLWLEGRLILITSESMLAELGRALRYPKVRLRHGMDEDAIERAIARFYRLAVIVEAQEHVLAVITDPDDNKVLECAIAGQAEVIVTGDKKHLLPLGSYEGIPIVSPADFLAMLSDG